MAGTAYQEWLDRNAHRAFPFVENTDFTCPDGAVLPTFAILDARFCEFDEWGFVSDVFLKRIDIKNGRAWLVLLADGTEVKIGSSENPVSGPLVSGFFRNFSYRLALPPPEDLAKADGKYDFSVYDPQEPKYPKFLKSRLLSIPYGIGVDTLEKDSTAVVGTVEVEDGYNTTLDISDNNLVLDIGQGLGLGPLCPERGGSEGGLYDGNLLYSINGQTANSGGDFLIVAGDGVTVGSGTYRYVENGVVYEIPAVTIDTDATIDSFTKGSR